MLHSTNTGPIGNYYDKFGSSNPLVRRLMARFKQSYADCFMQAMPDSVLEVGCGEGHILALSWELRSGLLSGIDLETAILQEAQENCPQATLAVGNGYQLPYPSKHFDLVVASEVLEHVEQPHVVLQEMARVSRHYCLMSVPLEPLWRVLNLARGKYVSDLGNTPGHVQHWSPKGFVRLVQRYFDVLEVRRPLPWTMVLCRSRKA